MRGKWIVASLLMASMTGPASAALITYTNQAGFEAALDGSFKLLNLDAAPYSGNPSGYRLSQVATALASDGLTSIGYDAQLASGQNGQTPTNRDWLILNGTAFSGGRPGSIAFSFATGVNGVGALSNILGDGDGGRVRAFSNTDLTGFLGEVQFGLNSGGTNGFGALSTTDLIRSVEITCDYNGDFACGVYDIQFGTFKAAAEPVPTPEPAALGLFGLGLLGIAGLRRRRV